ncbi:hypothetical protein L486_07734 [Kwoniella mangroviensis CBS 10435]|uniref:Uncharacterized protein n=1 Tax=Kwoniella mangroviensis CBS 10435 TaxID=1331196 RepID=A0A1B9IGG3_9TREE|nr:hypothetical protein L486_07734 [Kwoniella mangroviensis CBS 10435]OCF78774.1 hypothetical protein I204_00718 [Kwoniella mangroviensis CBS 8886]
MRLILSTITLLYLAIKVSADNFANFFADENCNEDGSIGFELSNPGCFAQSGRHSVYIPNNGIPWTAYYCLVITNDSDECNCQNEGFEFQADGFCHVLSGNAKSYRFISSIPLSPSFTSMTRNEMTTDVSLLLTTGRLR